MSHHTDNEQRTFMKFFTMRRFHWISCGSIEWAGGFQVYDRWMPSVNIPAIISWAHKGYLWPQTHSLAPLSLENNFVFSVTCFSFSLSKGGELKVSTSRNASLSHTARPCRDMRGFHAVMRNFSFCFYLTVSSQHKWVPLLTLCIFYGSQKDNSPIKNGFLGLSLPGVPSWVPAVSYGRTIV